MALQKASKAVPRTRLLVNTPKTYVPISISRGCSGLPRHRSSRETRGEIRGDLRFQKDESVKRTMEPHVERTAAQLLSWKRGAVGFFAVAGTLEKGMATAIGKLKPRTASSPTYL